MTPTDWQTQAACRDLDTDVFFPAKNDVAGEMEAKAVCRRCPVADACLAYAMSATDLASQHGIYGGLNPFERSKLRRGIRPKADPRGVLRRQRRQTEAVAAWRAGMDLDAIAGRLGVRRDTVVAYLRAEGIEVTLRSGRRPSADLRARVVELADQGMRQSDICRALSLHPGTVSRWLAAAGGVEVAG